eukprot:COSAG05_NODE_355_length_10856_cov_7.197174_7_plen_332_part_00
MGPRRLALFLVGALALVFAVDTLLLSRVIDDPLDPPSEVGNAGLKAAIELEREKQELQTEWERARQAREQASPHEVEQRASGGDVGGGRLPEPTPVPVPEPPTSAGAAMPADRQQHTDYKMPPAGQPITEAKAVLEREDLYRTAGIIGEGQGGELTGVAPGVSAEDQPTAAADNPREPAVDGEGDEFASAGVPDEPAAAAATSSAPDGVGGGAQISLDIGDCFMDHSQDTLVERKKFEAAWGGCWVEGQRAVLIALPFNAEMQCALRYIMWHNLKAMECANPGFNLELGLYDEPFDNEMDARKTQHSGRYAAHTHLPTHSHTRAERGGGGI